MPAEFPADGNIEELLRNVEEGERKAAAVSAALELSLYG